jgi:hypothetical protein
MKSHAKPQTPPRRHQKVSRVAKHRGRIKSTSNIREAVSRRKIKDSRDFISNFIEAKRKLRRGWNMKDKTYMFGGTAKIYVYIDSGSRFPVDDSAMMRNKFKVTLKRESDSEPIRVMKAWFKAFYEKTTRRNLGRMNYNEAKKVFEKLIITENKKFTDMTNQFSTDNRDLGSFEKLKWFKLIVR